MKRLNSKRHRPEEVVAKLRQADESLAKDTPIAEVARSLGVSEVTLHRWRLRPALRHRHAGKGPASRRAPPRRPSRGTVRSSRRPACRPPGALRTHCIRAPRARTRNQSLNADDLGQLLAAWS